MREISKKIILVGNVNVGKTSLVAQYVHKRFSENYFSTIGVRIEKKQVELKDTLLTMIIWDLAGETTQQNTPQSYFLGTLGIIYVLDISSPSSFLNAHNDLDFLRNKMPNVPILIAANKCDLLSDEALNKHLNMLPFKVNMVTSAKKAYHVEDLFLMLAEKML